MIRDEVAECVICHIDLSDISGEHNVREIGDHPVTVP